MGAPTVYRWDDTEAPVLVCDDTKAASSLVQLIRACLIDGYGEKTPPGYGYELRHVESDNSAIAFKSLNPASNGFWFQVATADAFNGTTGGDINQAYINMYEHMQSAIGGKVGSTSDVANVRTSSTIAYTNQAIPWVLIADDRFFYFFSWPGTADHRVSQNPDMAIASATSVICAGDYLSFGDDPWSSMVYGQCTHISNGGYFGRTNMYGSANNLTASMYFIRSATGEPGAEQGIVGGAASAYCYNYSYGVMGGKAYAEQLYTYAANSPVIIGRPILGEIVTSQQARGYIPGLYHPLHDRPFDSLTAVVIDGKNYLPINITVYSAKYGQVLISLDDWRVQ